jgi:hypothetical protein
MRITYVLTNNVANRVAFGIGGGTVGGTQQNRGYSGTIEPIDYYLLIIRKDLL